MKKLKKHHSLYLFVLCYGVALVAALLVHTAGLVHNKILYATGALVQTELTLADFELANDLVEQDGNIVSFGGDPQLVLQQGDLRVDTVYLEAEYSLPPRQISAMYNPPYSVRHMAFARPGGEGSVFWLPTGGVYNLRLDMGSVPYNVISVHKIVVNTPRPFYAFFVPAAGEVAALAVLPGLAGCVLSILGRVRQLRRQRKAGEATA